MDWKGRAASCRCFACDAHHNLFCADTIRISCSALKWCKMARRPKTDFLPSLSLHCARAVRGDGDRPVLPHHLHGLHHHHHHRRPPLRAAHHRRLREDECGQAKKGRDGEAEEDEAGGRRRRGPAILLATPHPPIVMFRTSPSLILL